MATKKQKDYAWENAATITGKNPNVWRKDIMGNIIRYDSYGTRGEFGWHVDHKRPVSKGGSEHLRNIQALHHEANRRKSNQYP